MARRKDNNDTPSFGSYRTVHLDFNDKERSEILALIDDANEDIAYLLEESVTDGWKVSLSYSAGWGNFVCSISPKEVSGFPKTSVFMFRHADFSRVIGFLRYFFGHMVKVNDQRLLGEDTTNNW